MSWKQGQDHLEGFMRFVEQSPHYNASEVMQFHIAYNNLSISTLPSYIYSTILFARQS